MRDIRAYKSVARIQRKARKIKLSNNERTKADWPLTRGTVFWHLLNVPVSKQQPYLDHRSVEGPSGVTKHEVDGFGPLHFPGSCGH